MKKNHFIPLLPLALACSALTTANAATYYVSTTGNDSAAGNNINTPFQTIMRAVNVAVAGDTVYIRSGTYHQQLLTNRSGTSTAPILISGYPADLPNRPVLDGTGMGLGDWDTMINLSGSYVTVSQMVVSNGGCGIFLTGPHDTANTMTVTQMMQNGILAKGDYSVVQSCTVSRAAWRNYVTPYNGGGWATGLSAARDPVNGITDYAILRGNTVFNNWGEGLSSYEAQGTLMEGNTVYDNWATNVYISDSSNVVCQKNMVYTTPGNITGRAAAGITLADEVSTMPRSQHNTVVNNLFLNADISLMGWTLVNGSGLNNVLFAHNTIVNGTVSMGASNTTHLNSRVVNNIMPNLPAGKTGVTLVGNYIMGAGSNSAKLAQTGPAGAGALTSAYFKFLAGSSALNGTYVVPEVTTDYFGSSRNDGRPDIGAHELRTNLARGKTVTASSRLEAQYDATYAVDGNAATRWSSVFSDPQWITVDLGATYTIKEVKLTWEAAYAKAFQVQVSTNGTSWTALYGTTIGTGGVNDLTGLSGSGRYVRVYGTQRATAYGYSLWELEVY